MKKSLRIAAWLIVLLLFLPVAALGWFWLSGKLRQTQNHADVAPRSGRFIEVVDTRLFIQELGPVHGPPLVFIHGTVAWSGTWRPTLEALAARGFRCLAIDMPPFGFSTRPFQDNYGREASALRIQRVVESLGLRDVTLIGHSFGARATVTAAAALANHSRLKALILVAPAIGFTNPNGADSIATPALLGQLFRLPMLRSALGSVVVHPRLTRTGLELFAADPRSITDDVLRTYQQPLLTEGKSASTGAWMREFLAVPDGGLVQSREVWDRLKVPVLLVWGEADTTTPLWQSDKLKALLPQAELEVYKGIGHLPQIESRDAFIESVDRFVKRLSSPR